LVDNVELAQKRWNMQIIFVDDNMYMRQTLKNMLSYLGYPNITAANDGYEAWKILSSEKVEMIIADLVMPGMSGIELLANVREDKKIRNIPFILISGEMNKESIQLAAENDVDAILIKPFDINKFRESIVASFKKRAIPNEERELIWAAEDAITDADMRKLAQVIDKITDLKDKGVKIKYYKYLCFKAILYLRNGEFSKVKELLAPEIDGHPYWVKFYDILAEATLAENNIEEALSWLKKGISVSPANLERIVNAIRIAKKGSFMEEARELLQKLEENSNYYSEYIYKILFEEYFIFEEWDKVIKLYQKMLKEIKEESVIYFFHHITAEAYLKIDDRDKALEIYARLLKILRRKEVEYPEVMLKYSKLLEDTKQPKPALAVLLKFMEMFPEFAEEHHVSNRIEELKKLIPSTNG